MYRKNNSGIPKQLGEAMKTIRSASATPDTWTDHLSDTRQGRTVQVHLLGGAHQTQEYSMDYIEN
jgi:hypothetical protein